MSSTTPEAPDAAPATTDTSAAPAPAPEATYAATAARLGELFPALFGGQPKPLKLRIQVDIQERAPGEFTKAAMSAFFRRYTGTTAYLNSVIKGEQRFDLDGQPAGELTAEHKQIAQDELARRKARHDERRQQEREKHIAERKAAFKEQRVAEAQQRQQHRAEHDERRQRIQLLRDFEGTRLTEANFCALKGIALADLPALLARAREDLKAMPPRPQGDPRRGPRPGGDRERGPRREGAPAREGDRPRGPRGERREGGGERRPGKPASTPKS